MYMKQNKIDLNYEWRHSLSRFKEGETPIKLKDLMLSEFLNWEAGPGERL